MRAARRMRQAQLLNRKLFCYSKFGVIFAAARSTVFVFDRETPVFGRPFQIGVELNYENGDTVAIKSSANGESNNATSWIQDKDGVWSPYQLL